MLDAETTGRFPNLGKALAVLDREGLATAVSRLVEAALASTDIGGLDRQIESVEQLMRTLDQAAYNLQMRAEHHLELSAQFWDAFRSARAATALLDQLLGEYEDAAYEAALAIGDEEAVLAVLGGSQ